MQSEKKLVEEKDESIQRLETKITQLEEIEQRLKDDVCAEQESVAEKKSNILVLEAELETKENQNRLLDNRLSEQKNLIDEKCETIGELETTIKGMEDEKLTLITEHDTACEAKDAAIKELKHEHESELKQEQEKQANEVMELEGKGQQLKDDLCAEQELVAAKNSEIIVL